MKRDGTQLQKGAKPQIYLVTFTVNVQDDILKYEIQIAIHFSSHLEHFPSSLMVEIFSFQVFDGYLTISYFKKKKNHLQMYESRQVRHVYWVFYDKVRSRNTT